MIDVLWMLGGLTVVVGTFLMVLRLLGTTERNEGELHGGGYKKYRRLHRGLPNRTEHRRGWRR